MTALQKGRVRDAVQVLQAWLTEAALGEPEALLSACPDEWRPKLALLLRDLLSRYPCTVLGAPVLLHCAEDTDDTLLDCRPPKQQSAAAARHLQLPYPSREFAQPCHDLHFLGWLPLDAQLPVALPFHPERYAARAPLNEICASVALFRSHPDVFDLDQLELPNQWWGEVFRPIQGNVQLSARMLLPYPDALEAARILEAAARGMPLPVRGGFLSDNAWAWARDAGELFQETCRHLYPSEPG